MTLFLALLLDWQFGDPDALWKRVPHPVAMIGRAIGFFDNLLNQPGLDERSARQRGVMMAAIIVSSSLFTGYLLSGILHGLGLIGWLAEIAIVSIFLAQKSLIDHVRDVATSLRDGGEEAGRISVAKIVGRDPENLDQSGISRAAIESLAENYSDGVVAPAMWYALLGLPGLLAYKAVNTADSMIAHKTPEYVDFGRATALLDDLLNWPAARLSALLIAIASVVGSGWRRGVDVMDKVMQQAGNHRSPNAGWPETAMAASLDIALGGPRSYGGEIVQEVTLNSQGREKATIADIDRSLMVFRRACYALWALALLFV